MRVIDEMAVYCQDRLAGHLRKTGEMTPRGLQVLYDFQYVDSALEEDLVSLAMPIGGRYDRLFDVPPAFQVSLPEGWVYKQLVSAYGKAVDLSDPFALLKVAGRNPVGRVTFGGTRKPARLEDALRDVILHEDRRCWMQDVLEQVSPEHLGVSGAMPKLVVDAQDGYGPFVFDQHILKLEQPRYFGIALAEEFALRCLANAGLDTVAAKRNDAGDALLVDRFDIRMGSPHPAEGSHPVKGEYLGFEDAAALSGFCPDFKYNGSAQKLFAMIDRYVVEEKIVADKEELLDRLLLNDILRNGDAHLKNFGLVYDALDRVRLAPGYDVLDTTLFLPRDFPAMTIRDVPFREMDAHRQWLTEDTLPQLWEVAELEGVGNRRQRYRRLQEVVWETAAHYRAEILADAAIGDDRKTFVREMVKRLEDRLRENPFSPCQAGVHSVSVSPAALSWQE